MAISDNDSSSFPVLVLIGAASGVGGAIKDIWPSDRLICVQRSDTSDKSVIVTDYRDVPPDIVPAGSVIVNCVGTPKGSADLLDVVNRQVPVAWYEAGVAAGASQFIQLSSFSVFGRCPFISTDTALVPETPYGKSKLGAERTLLERSRISLDGPLLTIIRIPMLFGRGDDKLRKLVRFARRTRFVPVVRPEMKRSMISYAGLAKAIVRLAASRTGGIVFAADPQKFTYDLLAERLGLAGVEIKRLPVPRMAAAFAEKIAPSIHGKLFSSSVLDERLNFDAAISPNDDLLMAIDRYAGGNT